MTKYYYRDGTVSAKYDTKGFHREDGPAIEYTSGDKEWWLDGRLHRVDGPAAEYSDGGEDWYVEGNRYTKTEFDKLMEEVKELPLALRLTDPREWVRKIVQTTSIL